jgi:predicted transcriptional regulator
MTAYKLQVAQEMYRSGQYTVAAIAKTLGVSRASVYRHLSEVGSRTWPRPARRDSSSTFRLRVGFSASV